MGLTASGFIQRTKSVIYIECSCHGIENNFCGTCISILWAICCSRAVNLLSVKLAHEEFRFQRHAKYSEIMIMKQSRRVEIGSLSGEW